MILRSDAVTNTKYNPHKRCGCSQCKLGASTKAGKLTHRATNRAIRHADKLALRINPDEYIATIMSTPYTD